MNGYTNCYDSSLHDNKNSWQNRLKLKHNIVNTAVGGISEYRIYRQLVDNIDRNGIGL